MKHFKRLVTLMCLLAGLEISLCGQANFAARYAELEQLIDENWDRPPASETRLEEYLRWMEIKAGHRNQVVAALQEINELSIQYPDNEEYKQWVQDFSFLLQKAYDSGTSTVNGASMKFLRTQERDGSDVLWQITLWRVRVFGRPIYLKAVECQFNTEYPVERSRCLLNYTIGMFESNPNSTGLYINRERVHGVMDNEGNINFHNKDYEIECEDRSSFVTTSEGEPLRDLMYAFHWAGEIRDECDWWKFYSAKQDVADLINEYYEDALCKQPPHKGKLGHAYFRELAEQDKDYQPSVDYNKGFYAILYGKVEINEDGNIKPAPNAQVTVRDYDETWTTRTDAKGNYEIKDVILHKDCSPFNISAVYEGDWVYDTYDGPLEEPDKNYRHEKNLLIIPKREYQWNGTLTINTDKNLHCEYGIDTLLQAGYVKKIEEESQRLNTSIRAKDEGTDPNMISFIGNDMEVSGNISARIFYHHEMRNENTKYRSGVYDDERYLGHKSFPVSNKDFVIQIVKTSLTDPGKFEDMYKKVAEEGFSDEAIEAMTRQLDNMLGDNEKSFNVKVMVQFHGIYSEYANVHKYRESWDRNTGIKVEEDEDRPVEMPLTKPVTINMTGTFTRGEHGDYKITASYSHSEQEKYSDKKCPPESVSLNCTLTLTRKRIR